MPIWLDYTADKTPDEHTVVGKLRLLPQVFSPQLENARDILVYLPPSYHRDPFRRYPVLYMHDGQNLFDRATSFSGEWNVDETFEVLAKERREAIVVGIPNTPDRVGEYSPYPNPWLGGGRGDAYLAFITDTIKPIVDADFRTLPGRIHTGIIGSSLGGLISLYAYARLSRIFGFVGALSPALWFARSALPEYIAALDPFPMGKIYLDAGGREMPSPRYLNGIRQMRDLLISKGYRPGENLLYVEDPEGTHTESAWARRLPDALRFLLR